MKRLSSRMVWFWWPLVFSSLAAPAQGPSADAERALAQLGIQQGLGVILGDDAASLAVDLARASEMMIYVQVPDADAAAAARQAMDQAGLLGKRISVGQGEWSHLHLADNLADAVIVREIARGSATVPRAEVLRVLRPGGKAFVGRDVVTKPWPDGTDDWSHPYHGPDNNPQSRDQLARGPYLTHFLSEPWYSPMPLVTVASGGRLFKAFGHIAIKQREWPLLNTLVAQRRREEERRKTRTFSRQPAGHRQCTRHRQDGWHEV